jgi:tripartite-type tricarboxylate transporter receptor subunit TctC
MALPLMGFAQSAEMGIEALCALNPSYSGYGGAPMTKFFIASVAALALASPSLAQTYPTHSVRAIVAFAPGGVTDSVARLVARRLSESLGQQVYVDNQPGATGNIGTALAAKAAPDGYTLLFAFSSFVVNPTLFDKLAYDAVKDFDPVSLAVTSTTVLTVNPMVPANSVEQLVALIKANPGKFSYSTAGAGTQAHLTGEQFRLRLGLDLVHVPFGGGSPAIAAVVGGHTPVGFTSPAASIPQIKQGNLRALAITGDKRSRILPDVPTMAESGYPEIVGDSWVGVLAPAGTPKDIIGLLQREIAKVIAAPDMQARLAELGTEPVASTPEAFAIRIKAEIATWAQVIRAAHIKPE